MQPVDQAIKYEQIPGVPGDCFRACVASIMNLPLEGVPHFMLFGDKWFDTFVLWIGLQGYDVRFATDADEVPADRFYILSGKSPRGAFNHAVVARNGAVVHDPHPDRTGVESFVSAIWGVYRYEA